MKISLLLLCLLCFTLCSQQPYTIPKGSRANQWAAARMDSMSLEEKVGQLFMVAAYSNRDNQHLEDLKMLVSNYNIGGVIFFQGDVSSQVEMTKKLQASSKTPLMVGVDGEWGLNMRLSDVDPFPKQMTLGAADDSLLTYKMGRLIAQQYRSIGVHVNFAPVVDVNINAENPVIGIRSFGQNKELVARHGVAYMRGLQDGGVMACAKHFPGHGDTDADSHKTLPSVIALRSRIDEIELYPFKRLFAEGVGSIMAAHLYVPALGTEPGVATSLSDTVLIDLLKNDLDFDGLVFSDALNMKGVSDYFETGELELKALKAGNDVLLFSQDPDVAIEYLVKAVELGDLDMATVERSCRRILQHKYALGLHNEQRKLQAELEKNDHEFIDRKAVEKSITLLRDRNNLIPLRNLDSLRIALVDIGAEDSSFWNSLYRYSAITNFSVAKSMSDGERAKLYKHLEGYNLVILGMHGNVFAKNSNYGITPQMLRTVRDINASHNAIVCLFTNPYALGKFFGSHDLNTLLVGYEDRDVVHDYMGQAIFGGISISGKLPVDASVWFKTGAGIETKAIRMKYTVPEELGLSSGELNKIDRIAIQGIKEGAYPGCQVLVAKDGHVIYNKSFGHHTYDSTRAVENTDLYDLASVTKIAATTASVMRLTDEQKMSIDSTLDTYIPEIVGGTQYANVRIRDMMAHQAGFFPWLPFFMRTMKDGEFKPGYYSKVKDDYYSVQVAENLYTFPGLRDTILWRISQEPISWKKKYKYSDFGFYMLHKAIENITGENLADYVQNTFYESIGMPTMTYNPLEKFDKGRITPTEDDQTFRKQLVHGYVHDQGAAIMGGVSGHAGLFSNANDLAKMMQMFVNGGEYAGVRYISDSTLSDFTRCQFCDNDNRRGAGFDKPVRSGGSGPTCNCVSLESFGHTGFTGITAWADPEENVVYIFLSNRVYPIADNKKILRLNTRTDIQEVIYNTIKLSRENGAN